MEGEVLVEGRKEESMRAEEVEVIDVKGDMKWYLPR